MISNPQSDNTIKKSLKSKIKQLESIEKISSLIYSVKNQETDQTYPNSVEESEKTIAYDNQQGLIDKIYIQDSGQRTDQELKSLKQFQYEKEFILVIQTWCEKNNSKCPIDKTFMTILQILNEQNYQITEYITSGGEGIIFGGYQKYQSDQQEDFIFKIIFNDDKQSVNEEIQIMKRFELNINIIKLHHFIEINENTFILVLEKCKYDLQRELTLISSDEIKVSFFKLFKLIFELLDGLIQFRIYGILHLDIKPQNILVNQFDSYLYSDFGISTINKQGEKINLKGYTGKYAPLEQKNQFKKTDSNSQVDFRSDVYSLGITFQKVIQYYKLQLNQANQDLITELESIINKNMIKQEQQDRKQAFDIHQLIFQQLIKLDLQELIKLDLQEFLAQYFLQIDQIFKLYQYDDKKDILHFQHILLYYSKIQLEIKQKICKSSQEEDFFFSYQRVAECYFDLGNFQEALQNYDKSLNKSKEINKFNKQLIAQNLNSIGACQLKFGNYDQALQCFQQSLEIFQQIKNQDLIADTITDIGCCYENLGDLNNGLENYKKSLEIRRSLYKGDHLRISHSLQAIANIYITLGKYQDAFKLLQESSQMQAKFLQGQHPSIAYTLHNIAYCLQKMCDYQTALKYFEESLNIWGKVCQENHFSIAESHSNIGECYQSLGQYQKSKYHFDICLEMTKKTFQNEDNLSFASCLSSLGNFYIFNGEYAKALEYHQKSLEIKKRVYKENHYNIYDNLQNLGVCYQHLGKYQQAIVFYKQSLDILKKTFQGDILFLAQILNNIAISQLEIDVIDALDYCTQALEISKRICTDPHIITADCLKIVGLCYQKLDDENVALDFFQQALEMKKQIFKEDHPEIAYILINIAESYRKLHQKQNALDCCLAALNIRRKMLEKGHHLFLESLKDVGICYEKNGFYDKALQFHLEGIEIINNLQIKNDKIYGGLLSRIARCYYSIGDIEIANEYQKRFLEQGMKMVIQSIQDP